MKNWYESKRVKGLKTQIAHEIPSLPIMERALLGFRPSFIIETGTAYYGLTLFLHELLPKTPLFTFDNFDPRLHVSWKFRKRFTTDHMLQVRRAFGKRVNFVAADIIQKKNIMLLALVKYPLKKFLYLDNGNKCRELVYYGRYLLEGDMLGVHDWGKEIGYFQPEVKVILEEGFEEHPANKEFEEGKLLTRLFVRK